MTGPDAAESGTRLVPAAVSVSAVIGRKSGKAAVRGEDFVDPQDVRSDRRLSYTRFTLLSYQRTRTSRLSCFLIV